MNSFYESTKSLSSDQKILELTLLTSEITRLGEFNCQNNCSGQGICNVLGQICICKPGYFLRDCS